MVSKQRRGHLEIEKKRKGEKNKDDREFGRIYENVTLTWARQGNKKEIQKEKKMVILEWEKGNKTRPDTRLPQSRAGGQGPFLRSLHHLGRSSEVKDRKNPRKVKCDQRTDQQTD